MGGQWRFPPLACASCLDRVAPRSAWTRWGRRHRRWRGVAACGRRSQRENAVYTSYPQPHPDTIYYIFGDLRSFAFVEYKECLS